MSWAHVQGTGAQATTETNKSLSCTFASPPTAGNLVVVTVAGYSTSTGTATVSDNQNAGNYATGTIRWISDVAVGIWYSVVVNNGTPFTITVTGSTFVALSITIDEYSFTTNATISVDASAYYNGSGDSVTLNTSLAVTGSNLIVAAVSQYSGSAYTAGSSCTLVPGKTGYNANYMGLAAEYYCNATSIDPAFTITGAVTAYTSAGVSFLATPRPMVVSPTTIPANHSGNLTLTLSGVGTSWTSGGTTFTLPSITGLTKVSQSVSSTTSATLVVTTGSGTGTGNISDGTNTASLTVGTASFTVSPSSGHTGSAYIVTATGTNTCWTQETASTLFSVSGGTGASIASISVTGNTSATFNLTVGGVAAPLTITETPTSDTATFTGNTTGTAYTTTGAGNWSATSGVWSPMPPIGGPQIGGSGGDTVTITNAITLDSAAGGSQNGVVTVGSQGATGVAAVTVNTGGTLAMNTGTSLSVGGDLILNTYGSPVFSMGAGCSLAWVTPSGSQYKWSHVNNGYSAINGTSGSPCSVSNSGAGTAPYMTVPSGAGGLATSTYCNWSNMGTSTQNCATLTSEGVAFVVSNNTFASCGAVAIPQPGAAQSVQYLYNQHSSTAGTKCISNGGSAVTMTTGTRSLIGCDFDQTVAITPAQFTVQYCIFRNATGFVAYGPTSVYDSNFHWQQGTSVAFSPQGPLVSNSYTLTTENVANAHNWNTSGGSVDCTFDGFIWDASYYTGGNNSSMFCIVGSPTTVQNVKFYRGIVLPGYANSHPGSIVSIQCGSPKNNRLTMEHCTSCLNGASNAYRIVFLDENLVAGVAPTAVTATLSAVVEITKASHGLSTGNTVYCSGFTNMSEINNQEWAITVVDSGHFTLNSSSGLGETWNSAGTYNAAVLPPGTILSFRANLGYCLGGSAGGYWMADNATYGALNVASPANCDYNSLYNGMNATPDSSWADSGQGYSFNASSVPGTHDLDYTAGTHGNTAGQNPGFVDTTRCFATWGASQLGGSPTTAQILNWMFTNNPSVQIPALLTWVRAGFVPTNPAYEAASYPGDTMTVDANGTAWRGANADIGAMAWISGSTIGAGAVTLGALVAAGTGTASAPSASSGTGAATLGSLLAAGTGTFVTTATGAAALGSLVAAGTGTATGVNASQGVGAAALGALAASGLGVFSTTGTGSAFLPVLIAAGLSGLGSTLFLPYDFCTVLMPSEPDATDPWGIDPGQTTIITTGLEGGP